MAEEKFTLQECFEILGSKFPFRARYHEPITNESTLETFVEKNIQGWVCDSVKFKYYHGTTKDFTCKEDKFDKDIGDLLNEV